MKLGETKSLAFKRLATKRANNALYSIRLLGNLSNTNNYSFTSEDIQKIFKELELELRLAKSRFQLEINKKRKIKL